MGIKAVEFVTRFFLDDILEHTNRPFSVYFHRKGIMEGLAVGVAIKSDFIRHWAKVSDRIEDLALATE